MIIGLSMKERDQLVIFNKLRERQITQSAAAQALRLSARWVRTKLKRFLKLGAIGLVHQNRGKQSSRVWDQKQKAWVMKLFDEQFEGFGPTFAAEKLEELYGIKVSHETLRKAMINAGHWHGRQRKPKHLKWRERKEYYGVMIQLDGSPHDWFEGRAPKCTLLVFIDDATSQILWLEFVPSESLESVMKAVRHYMELCGRPLSFYVDFGSVFSVNTNNPERDKITQFERACKELGVSVIHAHSPQAKGRVERSNKTHQDRLIKELRLAGISSMEEANKFVRNVYLPKHNKQFSVPAAKDGDVHRSIDQFELDNIFCIKESRLVQNDFTVQYKKRILQLTAHQYAVVRPKEEVAIHEQFNGKLSFFIRKIPLNFVELLIKPKKQKTYQLKPERHYKPAKNHPWKQSYKNIITSTANGGY
jgi:hypothetical protein